MDGIQKRNEILRVRIFGIQEGKSCVTNILSFYLETVDITGENWIGRLHTFGPRKRIS